MRRDFRRGLAWRWRLLEVPATNAIRLPQVWAQWFGVAPVFEGEHGCALSFLHYREEEQTRLLVPLRPAFAAAPGAVIAMACQLIAVKYACDARLAKKEEVARVPALRPPSVEDEEVIEQFPVGELEEPVIAEYANWSGWYIRDDYDGSAVIGTTNPDEAKQFTPREAREWLRDARLGRRPEIVLRYAAGARAEAEQRLTAQFADGW